jgi:hypothetical protein
VVACGGARERLLTRRTTLIIVAASLTRSAFADSGHGIPLTGTGSYEEDGADQEPSLRAGRAITDLGGSCGHPASLPTGLAGRTFRVGRRVAG